MSPCSLLLKKKLKHFQHFKSLTGATLGTLWWWSGTWFVRQRAGMPPLGLHRDLRLSLCFKDWKNGFKKCHKNLRKVECKFHWFDKWFCSFKMVGYLFGGLILGGLSDKIGRKLTFLGNGPIQIDTLYWIYLLDNYHRVTLSYFHSFQCQMPSYSLPG